MKKYIEIIEDSSKEVVSRMDVTNKSERQIDKIWDGTNINLNHREYSIQINELETELPLIQ